MNDRRAFLKTLLGGAVAAAVAPQFLAGAGRKWLKRKSGVFIPNPAYENAPFEIRWVFHRSPHIMDGLVFKRSENPPLIKDGQLIVEDPWPWRYLDADCQIPVNPYIEI